MDTTTIIGLLLAFVIVIGGFVLAIWIISVHHIAHKEERLAQIEGRNRERLALIEKGLNPNLADQVPEKRPSNRGLIIGLIIVAACLGRIVAYFVSFRLKTNDLTYIYVLPAFFVGFALLLNHFYRRRISSK